MRIDADASARLPPDTRRKACIAAVVSPEADPPWSGLRCVSRFRRAFAFIVLFGGMTVTANPGLAEAAPETFGPGKVDCQRLGAGQFDCLLTSLRITQDGNNVATFSLATLPAAEQAMFQKWCSTAADDCTVDIQGTRQAPESSRLSAVTSVRWTRLSLLRIRRPPELPPIELHPPVVGSSRSQLGRWSVRIPWLACELKSEQAFMLIENKYVAVAAALGFLLALFLTHGSLVAAFGILALVAGMGWAVRKLS